MEFKNLAEVTKLEEVPEGASVLAATAEGEVVRVPGDGLGGGGGAGGGIFTVTFSTEDMQTWTADKSNAEITDAFKAGMFVRGMMVAAAAEFYAEAQLGQIIDGIIEFHTTMWSNDSDVMTMVLTINEHSEVYMNNVQGSLS